MPVQAQADSSVFEQIAMIYNAANGLDNPDHMDLDPGYFRRSYSVPNFDLTRDIVLVQGTKGHAVAYGATVPSMNGTDCSILLTMYVHPQFRKAGIGSQLLASLLARARDLGAKNVICNVPSFRPSTMSFLEKRSFERLWEWIKLVHSDISQVHGQARSSELTYHIIEEQDADAWASYQNALFRGSFNYKEVTPEDCVKMMHDDAFCKELALFGLHNGRTIAYCVGTLLGPTGSPVHERRLVIDGIGVTPPWRRHGFGTAILKEILTRAAAMGVKQSELIVDSQNNPAIKMYRRAGYLERYRRIWYQRILT